MLKIGFIVGDIVGISGGSNVIFEYAHGLSRLGHTVILISEAKVDPSKIKWHRYISNIKIMDLQSIQTNGESFDFVFATWWKTVYQLWRVQSKVYSYFNQSFESRFHSEEVAKFWNRYTYIPDLLYFTEAAWIKELILSLCPNAKVLYIQNRLNNEFFPVQKEPTRFEGPLRVLIEGPYSVPFKGVPETIRLVQQAGNQIPLQVGWLSSATSSMRPKVNNKPVEIYEKVPISSVRDILRNYDVMIKLSTVEGMFGPPLEMFSQGGTVITNTVTGSDEFLVHGWNGLQVYPYSYSLIPGYLTALSRDRKKLQYLKSNALETARAFADWEPSVRAFSEELNRLSSSGYSNAWLREYLERISSLTERWLEAKSCADVNLKETRLVNQLDRLKGVKLLKRLLPGPLKHRIKRALLMNG